MATRSNDARADEDDTLLRVRGCATLGKGASRSCRFGLAAVFALVAVLASIAGCGSPDRETAAGARLGTELQAARGLILGGQYAEARAALQVLVGRHPDHAGVARELNELEGLLGIEMPPLARPAGPWLGGIREHVEAAESAWAQGDTSEGTLAAEQVVILVDALPFRLEDEALQRRIARVRRSLAAASDP